MPRRRPGAGLTVLCTFARMVLLFASLCFLFTLNSDGQERFVAGSIDLVTLAIGLALVHAGVRYRREHDLEPDQSRRLLLLVLSGAFFSLLNLTLCFLLPFRWDGY